MAKIFYGVSGEGRGHAARAQTLIGELVDNGHEVTLFASGQGHALLAPQYGAHGGTTWDPRQVTERSSPSGRPVTPGPVTLERIPGLAFHYSQGQRLAYGKTGWHALRFMGLLPSLVDTLVRRIEAEQPDLIITDFEPALPRAARRAGVPFISLDHQHFLVTYDLSSLPWPLRYHAAFMGSFCGAFCRGQEHTVVSSFYFPPLRPRIAEAAQVTQIGVLLRPEIYDARPSEGAHLVAYLRRFSEPHILRRLNECGVEVRIYGLGAQPPSGNLRFMATDLKGFAEDLASCRGLVSTAGNQLVGEALFLGKSVLAMPEPGNREQQINAHFLARSGGGLAVAMERLDGSHLRRLLDADGLSKENLGRQRLHGNPQALEAVERQLGTSMGCRSDAATGRPSARANPVGDLKSVA